MDAVHRYEGTMNQVLGDGMMLWLGTLIAREAPTVRGYAVLAMQTAVKQRAGEVRHTHGIPIPSHMGLNAAAEEVLVPCVPRWTGGSKLAPNSPPPSRCTVPWT
jgi:hypothetical protein